MPKHKTQPWKETRSTRAIRFSDTEWEALGKAASAAKKTKADYVRERVLADLQKLGLLALLAALVLSCGGRTDLLEGDVGSRSSLFVPLGAGIKTDVDDKLLPVGKDLEVENMQFDLTGSLSKRFGHLAQGATVQPGGATLPQPWQLAVHKGARVSLSTPGASPLATYSQGDAAWNIATTDRRGPVTTAIDKIKSGGNNPRIAVGGGFYFLLYQDANPLTPSLMHFDVFDATTKHLVNAQTFNVAAPPVLGYDVLFCNGLAVAITIESGVGVVFHTMTPSTKVTVATTFAAVNVTKSFDSIVLNATTISVVFTNNLGNAAGVDFVPSTLTPTAFAIHDSGGASVPIDIGCAWFDDLGTSGKLALVSASVVGGVKAQWDLSLGATRTATTTFVIDATVVANINHLAAFTTASSAAGTFVVMIGVTASPVTNNIVKWGGAVGGAVQPASVLFRSLTLMSRPWKGSGDFFAMFSFPSLLTGDGNDYIMRIPAANFLGSQPSIPTPQAIFSVGSGGNIDQLGALNGGLTRILTVNSSQFVTSISYVNRIGETAASALPSAALSIALVTVSHLQPTGSPTTGAPIEAADSLLVPGGVIGQYDGVVFSGMGFAYAPQAPSFVAGAGGALTLNSTYWYVLVYSYMDAQGRLWRSGTSTPTPFATGANNAVTINCPTLRVTGRTNVFIELYRGAANDENLFQKVGDVPNDVTVDTVGFFDTYSDAQLANGEELYTGQNNNAILNNDTIPGSPFVWVWQNRIWFISADDPTELWFSNIISPGNGPRFNSQNIVRLADSHGPTYAAGVMDDKIVAIKADAVYSWNGDGPDDAGNGGYSPPLIVALGIGSTNPRSVVSSKDGVFFDSTSSRPGLQMVDHGLSIASAPDGSAFAGAVQRYAGEQIMSAILVPEQSQVRFYCLSGRVLVYDMVSKNWATFLLAIGGAHVVSVVPTGGAALVALDNQTIWLEDATGNTYTDNGAAYSERLATPWIATGGVNGFERLIQLIGAGKTMDDHTLTVQKLHNFNDSTIVETKTFNETLAATPLWNWEWNRPRFARMSSVKLILVETASSTTNTGAGFKTEGVTMLLGLREGLNRQATNTRGP